MAVTVTSTLRVGLNATQSNAIDLGTTNFPLRYAYSKAFPNGTTTGKADKLFTDQRTIAASGNEDLDLAGVLLDAFGAVLTFAKVKAIIIEADAGNTNSVVVKGAASNGFTGPFGAAAHTISIPPGGIFVVSAPAAGWTVTAGTGDLLNIANSGGTTGVTYKISVLGTSA